MAWILQSRHHPKRKGFVTITWVLRPQVLGRIGGHASVAAAVELLTKVYGVSTFKRAFGSCALGDCLVFDRVFAS